MELNQELVRELIQGSRLNLAEKDLPEIKAYKLNWSLRYNNMQRANTESRCDTLAQPHELSYNFPTVCDYNAQEEFKKLHESTMRTISPKFKAYEHTDEDPSPVTYQPRYEFKESTGHVLINRSPARTKRIICDNKVGPGQYNPYIGEEFERRKRGVTLKGRDSPCYEIEINDELGGEEVLNGLRACSKCLPNLSINQSERFREKEGGE